MLRGSFIYRISRDKNNLIWAVAENGLYTLDNNGVITGCVNVKDGAAANKQSLPVFSLLDAYEDESGMFWLATNGEGLYRWNPKDNSSRQFNITAGFPSDILYRIEADNSGNLWISTDNGLVRFNISDFTAYTYTTKNGLSHNEFNRTSSFKAKDGRLFFGGLNGVNAFYPNQFSGDSNTNNIPLRVISCSQFSKKENSLLDKTIELNQQKKITLQPGDRFFTIEFSLLDFETGIHRYAYKIDGIDKDWNYINENSIRISGLPYGDYHLHIKAQMQNGQWSKMELNIPVSVLKPFYLQWWFIVIVSVACIAVLVSYFRWRTLQLVKDKKHLEQTVFTRTEQLRESLDEKESLLKEIHHRVKNNLEVISSLLMLQTNSIKDEKAKAALAEGQSRVQSIALIHHKLYRTDNLATVELGNFINDLYKQVSDVFKKPGDIIEFAVTGCRAEVNTDTAVPMGLILNELFTNSFKYAVRPGKKNVFSLHLEELAPADISKSSNYKLTFRDNGPGMAADFNIEKSNSLGMKVIQLLTRQLGGSMKYYNNNGSVFEIQFPKTTAKPAA
jgi:two-component sensor histidine kinase